MPAIGAHPVYFDSERYFEDQRPEPRVGYVQFMHLREEELERERQEAQRQGLDLQRQRQLQLQLQLLLRRGGTPERDTTKK